MEDAADDPAPCSQVLRERWAERALRVTAHVTARAHLYGRGHGTDKHRGHSQEGGVLLRQDFGGFCSQAAVQNSLCQR